MKTKTIFKIILFFCIMWLQIGVNIYVIEDRSLAFLFIPLWGTLYYITLYSIAKDCFNIEKH